MYHFLFSNKTLNLSMVCEYVSQMEYKIASTLKVVILLNLTEVFRWLRRMTKSQSELNLGRRALASKDPNCKTVGYFEYQNYKFSVPKAPKILKNCSF